MEFMSYPFMEMFYGEKAEQYRELHMTQALLFLPYGCMVDEFQHIIYDNPDMTPDERHGVWKSLEEKYHPFHALGGAWMKKDHIFTSPFYYIDYCLAHICALQLWNLSREDMKTALMKYNKLCSLGGTDTLLKLLEKSQPYHLVWSATAEEEVCGRNGIELMVPELGPVALGIIGEPTGMQMAVAEKGLMVLDCTARGKSGHAAREEGVNAIYQALHDIEWFRHYRFPRVSPYLGPVKMSVTMIQAGTQHNVVPDTCTFVVDVRPNGMYTNPELLALIKESVSCEVKERSTRIGSSHIDMSHPVVQRGLSLGLQAFGSPTTSNQAIVPFTTLKIGPGQSSRSHTADEYIEIQEITSAVETYVSLLDGLEI